MIRTTYLRRYWTRQTGVRLGLLAFAFVLAGSGLAVLDGPALAQGSRIVPSSPLEVQYSYAPLVKRAVPSVVNVYAAHAVQNHNPLLDDPFFRRFFGGDQGIPQEQIARSLGSGVIVDPSGLVVTNFHVIKDATEVKVALADKREFEAEIVLKDSRTDLAVLRLKGIKERLPALEFANSDEAQVGDVVLAIGNPFAVGQTVTHGIISAVARTQVGISNYQFFLQTDAAINPGNSGGPLLDMHGRLVGLNTAIYSRSGGSQGIGFAIPSNMVKVVVASAKRGGKTVQRPWLGAELQAVTPEIAEGLNLTRPTGALVTNVDRSGPAERAGLRPGDLIVSIDGQKVDDPNTFDYRFAIKPISGDAKLGIMRDGREQTVSVALEKAPDVPRDEKTIAGRSPFTGLKVGNLSPALADEMRIEGTTKGVVVLGVEDGTPAQVVGFQTGDVLESINGSAILKTADLEKVSGERSRVWRITFNRGGRRITVSLTG